jgi:glycosyltransferase involved in cell wall biosynthesis
MLAGQRLRFCIAGDGRLEPRLRENLRSQGIGNAEILTVRRWEELGDQIARNSDSEILILLDDDLAPSSGWLEGLGAQGDDFDVLTSRVRNAHGGSDLSPAGEAGTVMKSYVPRAIGWNRTDESFAERCQRFGFRVAELLGGELLRSAPNDPCPSTSRPELGFNVFGFLSGNLGLGVAARHYLKNFMEAGLAVQPVEILVGGGRALHDVRYRDISRTLDDETPYPVNVFILNPSDLAVLMQQGYEALQPFGERINVCIPFWELPRIPPSWVPTLEQLDIVLAGSSFIQYSLLAELSGPSVRYLPHPLYLEPGYSDDRSAWGIPERTVVFISAFELASDLNRKNPFATIDAFNRAFSKSDDAILLLKINNSKMQASFERHLDALRAHSAQNPRIILVDEVLEYKDVLSLYASADVFVSLHRAEGLGLGMLEAMSLGKTVIATGWSGNMDFMNEQNSCLVGYDFTPVEASTQAAYTPEFMGGEAKWADPNIDEAAAWMRRLAEDAELRRHIGKQAAADMAQRQHRINPSELVAAVQHRLELRGPGSG